MNRLFFILCILVILAVPVSAASYLKIQPDFLIPAQSSQYEKMNEALSFVFAKIRPSIKTEKYPKYYHDFTKIPDDGTQSKSYYYVNNNGAELIYNIYTNELKYVSFKRLEYKKCRIIYDYPSGKFHAVEITDDDGKHFVFGSDGKYVDYEPYVKEVQKQVKEKWKVPARKQIDVLAKGQKDLLVQIALTVNKDGSVSRCKILKSSKIKELDENAGEAIKSAAPFNGFPENFFNDELTIILNFNFSL